MKNDKITISTDEHVSLYTAIETSEYLNKRMKNKLIDLIFDTFQTEDTF